MPDRYPRRRPRAGTAVAVLGLHLVAAGLLLRLGAWRDRGPSSAEQAPLVVTLVQLARPAAAPAAPVPVTRASPRVPRKLDPSPASALPQRPPGPAAPQTITLPAAAAAPAAPPGATTTAPLNLALPRAASAAWRSRNPALDDPRANSARRSLESSIAAALGGGDQITEEHLEDGSIRFRRGSQCVVARPNRAQQIDPFNSSVLPKPRLMEKC
jgi:hypothetical protein